MKVKKEGIYDKYDKRIELLKSGKENPSPEELQEAYGYLDYCFVCGNPITFLDRITFNVEHSIMGNSHRWRCKLNKQNSKQK